MKSYTLLFRGGLDFTTASPEEMQGVMMKWKTWMDGLAADGRMLPGGQRLTPGHGAGAVVKGKDLITDGPFAEGKEVVTGFIAIKAESLEEAAAIAKDCPIYEHEGSTEVREIATM